MQGSTSNNSLQQQAPNSVKQAKRFVAVPVPTPGNQANLTSTAKKYLQQRKDMGQSNTINLSNQNHMSSQFFQMRQMAQKMDKYLQADQIKNQTLQGFCKSQHGSMERQLSSQGIRTNRVQTPNTELKQIQYLCSQILEQHGSVIDPSGISQGMVIQQMGRTQTTKDLEQYEVVVSKSKDRRGIFQVNQQNPHNRKSTQSPSRKLPPMISQKVLQQRISEQAQEKIEEQRSGKQNQSQPPVTEVKFLKSSSTPVKQSAPVTEVKFLKSPSTQVKSSVRALLKPIPVGMLHSAENKQPQFKVISSARQPCTTNTIDSDVCRHEDNSDNLSTKSTKIESTVQVATLSARAQPQFNCNTPQHCANQSGSLTTLKVPEEQKNQFFRNLDDSGFDNTLNDRQISPKATPRSNRKPQLPPRPQPSVQKQQQDENESKDVNRTTRVLKASFITRAKPESRQDSSQGSQNGPVKIVRVPRGHTPVDSHPTMRSNSLLDQLSRKGAKRANSGTRPAEELNKDLLSVTKPALVAVKTNELTHRQAFF